MKKILVILATLAFHSCNAQKSETFVKMDKIPFDMNSGNVSQDTLRYDVNGDGLKDILLQFDYRNFDVKIPKGNSGHELAIYLNYGKNEYRLKNVNRKALWVIHTSIFSVDNTTFCIVNEEGGQDPNNYYCYFQFDKQRDNWNMIKYQIKTFNTGREVLIDEKVYKYENQLPFEEVSFDKLFGKMHNDVGEPTPLLELIKVSKAIIYNLPNTSTQMYLIKGNEVEVLETKGDWLKIRYYGKKVVEGWIKKTDVE
ncbi:hypothetical protein SAMN04515674_11132 [Pseudarcicella hirudinis]|uniref:SH3 domain-containing protein n=1 Tax=Pseudarcicella hirudinis TaxID=1079859 RepID=A0A1I5W7P2_9BACT|nr:SH3 domain-containing protein [Pseudarcicella hirudinis]SFQ15784.1 hypothetical protein SAMN04515674_11132 [Pseudarcicella hirudinis]